MAVVRAALAVLLLASALKPVEAPFLEAAAELWDPNYQRLTIYFDPGRTRSVSRNMTQIHAASK